MSNKNYCSICLYNLTEERTIEILMLDLKSTNSAIPSHWSLQLNLNSSPCLTPTTMVPKLKKNQIDDLQS